MLLGLNLVFLCEILLPENWVQMIIWYSLLIVCLVVFIFSLKRKRSSKRSVEINERIKYLEELKNSLLADKAISRKDMYTHLFQLSIIKDYCLQKFERSQFIVYDEAFKSLDIALLLIKDLDLKKWQSEKNKELREKISVECDNTVNYLRQAV